MVRLDKIPERAFVRIALEEAETLELKPLFLGELIATTEKNKKIFYVIRVYQFMDTFVICDNIKKFEHLIKNILTQFKEKAEGAFKIKMNDAKFIIKDDYFMIVLGDMNGKEIKSIYKEISIGQTKMIMKYTEYDDRTIVASVELSSLFRILYREIYENYVDVSDLV